MSFCQSNDSNGTTGNGDMNNNAKVFNYLWYKLIVKPDATEKHFMFNGQMNGDVLTERKGCCTTFTSERANLIIEWCTKNMRYKLGKADFK